MEETKVSLNLNEICFTCLSSENLICVPGSHEEYDEFVRMFYRFTSVKITDEAIVICETCVSRLNESHQFREMCIESYKTFQSLQFQHSKIKIQDLKQNNGSCNEEDLSMTKEDRSEEIIESENCNISYTHENGWNSSNPIVCGICTEVFENVLGLHLHFTSKHNKEQDELEKIVKTDEVSNEEQTNFICSKCGQCFSLLTELKLHVQHHMNAKSSKMIGSDKFKKSRSYNCSICNKSFSSRFMLNRHHMSHSGEKPFKCQICPSTFYSVGDLNIHMRVHTGEKPYICPICDKPFRRTSHLTVHMRVHTGEKPYKCKICDKGFAQSGDLTAHQRIHTGEKPFTCNFCEKRFVQGSALKAHLKRHFNVSCTNCLKVFMSYGALKEHQEECQTQEKSSTNST